MHLQQTFDAAILTNLHPRSQIDIFVEVTSAAPIVIFLKTPMLGKIFCQFCMCIVHTMAIFFSVFKEGMFYQIM